MRPFTRESGVVLPLDRPNVDTDQIIPKQFLKSIRRTGFGENLFDGWRFLDEGDIGVTPNERVINHDFVLNDPRYQDARILLARENFGCGSSREHAVWALLEYGFRVVIAPSFADIFLSNCFKNGLLPIVLKEEIIQELFELCTGPQALTMTVDLLEETIGVGSGSQQIAYAIEERRKISLLRGVDDIALTLAERTQIEKFENSHQESQPWLFAPESSDA
jgi:3-isopropylmalate/(R)-2-methylmalate dehydratase small subunit